MNPVELMHNPNAMGVRAFLGLTSEQQDSLLGSKFSAKVRRLKDETELPQSDVDAVCKTSIPRSGKINTHTQVIVWGTQESGKTSVVASLMGCVKENWIQPQRQHRALAMCRNYSEGKFATLPNRQDSRTECSRLIYRRGLKRYVVSLIEAPLVPSDSGRYTMDDTAKRLLKLSGEQIHLLCIDGSADQREQEKQEKALINIIDQLNLKNIIKDKTVGIYVLVTKTDAMYMVPREHREMAARDLVTKGHVKLWKKLWNVCSKHGIRSNYAFAHTIGDVKLQRVVERVDLKQAHKLWSDIILPYCQPLPAWWEYLMWWGNKKTVWLAATVLIALMAWKGVWKYVAWDNVGDSFHKVELYNYNTNFQQRVREKIGKAGDFYAAREGYAALMADLNREHSILLRDTEDNKSKLLPDSCYGICAKLAVKEFASIIHLSLEKMIQKSTWVSTDLSQLNTSAAELLATHLLKGDLRQQMERCCTIKQNYIDTICSLYAWRSTFDNLQQVRMCRETMERYMYTRPYKNLDSLLSANYDAALGKYLTKLESEADLWYNKAYGYRKEFDKEFYPQQFQENKERFDKIKKVTDARIDSLRAVLDSICDEDLTRNRYGEQQEDQDSRMQSIRIFLNDAKETIDNIEVREKSTSDSWFNSIFN